MPDASAALVEKLIQDDLQDGGLRGVRGSWRVTTVFALFILGGACFVVLLNSAEHRLAVQGAAAFMARACVHPVKAWDVLQPAVARISMQHVRTWQLVQPMRARHTTQEQLSDEEVDWSANLVDEAKEFIQTKKTKKKKNKKSKDEEELNVVDPESAEIGRFTYGNFLKGYGFIEPLEGGDALYFHSKSLVDPDADFVKGDLVSFVRQFDDRLDKWVVAQVNVIPEGKILESEEVQQNTETGKISAWDFDRGFGFVLPDDGGDELYTHASDLVDGRSFEGKDFVVRGDAVKYYKVFDEKRGKWQAQLVRRIPVVVGFDGNAEEQLTKKRNEKKVASLLNPEAYDYDPFGGKFEEQALTDR